MAKLQQNELVKEICEIISQNGKSRYSEIEREKENFQIKLEDREIRKDTQAEMLEETLGKMIERNVKIVNGIQIISRRFIQKQPDGSYQMQSFIKNQ